jgi:hypothetical protein
VAHLETPRTSDVSRRLRTTLHFPRQQRNSTSWSTTSVVGTSSLTPLHVTLICRNDRDYYLLQVAIFPQFLPKNLDHIAPNYIDQCKSAMETPHSTKESRRSITGSRRNTLPPRHTPLMWYIEFFFWYINTVLAHVCWVVTMIDNKGGLTGVRLGEFWQISRCLVWSCRLSTTCCRCLSSLCWHPGWSASQPDDWD